MITVKFNKLRREKAARENRNLPLRVIAEETHLSIPTVQRLSKGNVNRVYFSTIDTLCAYFEVANICDFIEFTPGPAPTG